MFNQDIANTFTDAPFRLEGVAIKQPHSNWLLRKLGVKKSQPLFIYPLPIGKAQLIGVELSNMLGVKDLEGKDHTEQINSILAENIPSVVRIIALASCKGREMPSEKLVNEIANTLTITQIHTTFFEVYRRLDLTTFFDIMALSKNLSLNLIPDKEALGQS